VDRFGAGIHAAPVFLVVYAFAPQVCHHLFPARARGHQFRRQIQKLHRTSVTNGYSSVRVDHHDSLIDILQCSLEQRASCLQIFRPLVDLTFEIPVQTLEILL
jgi:hypothetical protein